MEKLNITRKLKREKMTEVKIREERTERWKKEQKNIRRLVKEMEMKYWLTF